MNHEPDRINAAGIKGRAVILGMGALLILAISAATGDWTPGGLLILLAAAGLLLNDWRKLRKVEE